MADLSWEIMEKGKELEEMSLPVSTGLRLPIPQHLITNKPLGMETWMEQCKSYLLLANSTRKFFALAVASGIYCFQALPVGKEFL